MNTQEIEEFNRRCGSVLKWKYLEVNKVWECKFPDGFYLFGVVCCIHDMHFHDSYDWAMLLVVKVHDKTYDLDGFLERLVKAVGWSGGLKTYYHGEDITHDDQVGEMFLAPPLQISTAALEVLEEHTAPPCPAQTNPNERKPNV